eukprot:gnl/TRDRNA2_/TRDRNA2_85930_c1_seq1.p1 gnl/TRDRNA2_/TRDRNA2_85930_c1~~gnl/TRDRNA2_/TRDRNA2_85930_c1_seq1.p1  ORF type:complete len:679 (-),score=122.86 gnl/TRDRNA2_/TRDRNA2_85930_c1_seq1:119-2155(-)
MQETGDVAAAAADDTSRGSVMLPTLPRAGVLGRQSTRMSLVPVQSRRQSSTCAAGLQRSSTIQMPSFRQVAMMVDRDQEVKRKMSRRMSSLPALDSTNSPGHRESLRHSVSMPSISESPHSRPSQQQETGPGPDASQRMAGASIRGGVVREEHADANRTSRAPRGSVAKATATDVGTARRRSHSDPGPTREHLRVPPRARSACGIPGELDKGIDGKAHRHGNRKARVRVQDGHHHGHHGLHRKRTHGAHADVSLDHAIINMRSHLIKTFGTATKAFRALDANNSGRLSLSEMGESFAHHHIKVSDFAGHHQLKEIFKVLDTNCSGDLAFQDLMGEPEVIEERNEWEFLSTAEKWTKWCSLTGPSHFPAGRKPIWRDDEGSTNLRYRFQERRDFEQVRMRKMIAQGLHKTKNGMKLLATHLPHDMDEDSVRRYRRDALEQVSRKSRRIHQALVETSAQRHVIKQCSARLREIEHKNRQHHLQEMVAARKAGGGGGFGLDMAAMFSEESLSAEEREARELARVYDIPIPDVEAIQAQYEAFNSDGFGITRAAFPKMLESVMGKDVVKEFTQMQIGQLWRSIDEDNSGRISFAEYLVWHHGTWGSPSLQQQRPKKGAKKSGPHGAGDTMHSTNGGTKEGFNVLRARSTTFEAIVEASEAKASKPAPKRTGLQQQSSREEVA